MSQAMMEMPKYTCHKKVWALKISGVGPVSPATDEAELFFEDSGFAPIKVDAVFIEKHQPEIGGYYVVYIDGYKSFSPANAFEDGYTRDLCSAPLPQGATPGQRAWNKETCELECGAHGTYCRCNDEAARSKSSRLASCYLSWSHLPPPQPGWYFMRQSRYSKVNPTEIFQEDVDSGQLSDRPLWFGPVIFPEDR